MRRRSFLFQSVLTATSFLSSRCLFAAQSDLSITGEPVASLKPFDELMLKFLAEQQVPGAALAVAQDGKLLYQRGFGWSDRENQKPVQPDSLFRIASVSKPITAMAILKLREQQKLDLNEPVLPILQSMLPRPIALADRRWEQVTIKHCLQHTGGWDRDQSFDPIGRPRVIAKHLGTETPVAPLQIVEYMLSQKLDFDPGSKAVYSNFGYIILGRIIEHRAKCSYESFVKQEILRPLGAEQAQLGRARRADQPENEVMYYDRQTRKRPSLYPADQGAEVALPYGAENFEAYEAHGGWTSTAGDLVRFASLLLPKADVSRVLTPASIASIKERPSGEAGYTEAGEPKDVYNGLGWMVRPVRKRSKADDAQEISTAYGPPANLWHAGFIAGTEALLVHRHDNLQWAVLFNTQSTPSGKSLIQIIDPLLHQAATESGIT
jgi:CubicO group peptidase (beta-lactamase class C family)